MKNIFITLPIFLLLVGCSTKEICKSPELLDLNNDTMSFIKGGEFFMGEYDDKFGDKKPREVYVNSFYLDRTEITNGVYRAYIEEKACGVRKPKYIDDPLFGEDSLPVVDITHKEAQNFCKFYGKRLPTEAEWEYGARGNLEYKKFPWGDDENIDYMNFRDSNNSWSVPVQSYIPNTYFLYDMTGNVREWVEDSYEKDFYTTACKKSPLNLKPIKELDISLLSDMSTDRIYKSNCYLNPINITKNKYKVNRGGSWEYSEGYPVTVSFRSFDLATHSARDLGFRCAHSGEKEIWAIKKIREMQDGL